MLVYRDRAHSKMHEAFWKLFFKEINLKTHKHIVYSLLTELFFIFGW